MIVNIQNTIKILLIFNIIFFVGCEKSSTEPKNNPPDIQSIIVSPSSVPASGIASVKISATDTDHNLMEYAFSVDGGSIVGKSSHVIWKAPDTPGSNTMSITVSDGEGGETTGTGTLTVTAPVTQITGICRFEESVTGTILDTKKTITLYNTWQGWWNMAPGVKKIPVTVVNYMAYFSITGIQPKEYFLDFWQDTDNDMTYATSTDIIGVYGTGERGSLDVDEFQVSEGETTFLEITLYIVP